MGIKNYNLTEVLFNKAQQQVLGLLYSNPDRDFYTTEIIRLSKTGSGAIQRELIKLTSAGLITMHQIGNQKHYQANRDTPLFSELRSIVLKTFGLADVIRNTLKSVKEQISFAFIYGSIAKQEDTAKSDIDLMIISDNLTYAELFKLLEKAEIQLGRSINPTFYSPSEWINKTKKENNFVNQLQKQPKIFLIGNENDFNAIR